MGVCVCVCHHSPKKTSNIRNSLFKAHLGNTSEVHFLLFFHQVNFTCPNLFRPLTWKRIAISVTSPTKVGFRNLIFCCNVPFILESRRHFLMRYNFEGINMPMSGKHLDETHRPCKTWGKCELCCLESLYHLILEGEVCVCISWLYLVSYYLCRCIYVYCVFENTTVMQSAPKLQFGNFRSGIYFHQLSSIGKWIGATKCCDTMSQQSHVHFAVGQWESRPLHELIQDTSDLLITNVYMFFGNPNLGIPKHCFFPIDCPWYSPIMKSDGSFVCLFFVCLFVCLFVCFCFKDISQKTSP